MKYPFGVMRINITTRCNFNCKFCGLLPGGVNLEYNEPGPEEWIRGVARQEGIYAIIISGGEPGLYGKVGDLARIVDSFPDIPTKIYTNASKPDQMLAIENRKNLGFYISYHYKKMSFSKFKKNVLRFKAAKMRMSNIHCPSIRVEPDRDKIEANLLKLREAGLSVSLDHPYLGWEDGITTGRLNDPPTGEMLYYDNKANDRTFAERKFRKHVRCSIKEKPGAACMFQSIAPDGSVWFCYRGFVEKEMDKYLGNFFSHDYQFDPTASVECNDFGFCNICDGFGRKRELI